MEEREKQIRIINAQGVQEWMESRWINEDRWILYFMIIGRIPMDRRIYE